MFKNNSKFVAAIQEFANLEECRVAYSHGSEVQAQDLLSDSGQLSQLCTACFWASMEREERREVRGTLAICTPHSSLLARYLTHEVPVTVPNLVSLLTASPRAPLAVHGGAAGLHIWGMLDAAPEELILLRITGNGTLQASQSGNVLALYQKGTVSTPEAGDVKSLGHLMARTLDKKHFLEIQSDIPTRIIRMVTTMIHHGHGGTLVIVDPTDQSWIDSVRFEFTFGDEIKGNIHDLDKHYGIDVRKALNDFGSSFLEKTDGRRLNIFSKSQNSIYLHTLTESLFYRVGELSLVDGAVIIDMNLKLYGFGAKLKLGHSFFPITALNAVTGALHKGLELAQLGGMRHQSAACFVNNNRLVDVFVVSQDGRLSLFCWSNKLNCVAVVQNLEHFIWEFQSANSFVFPG